MKLNLKWLWITWQQVGSSQDFPTWVIQNHTANQEAFINGLKEGRSDVYYLPKEIKQKVLTME